MPARQYLLQALPVALATLNVYSEAQRKGYVTLTGSAHAPSSKGAGSLYSPACRQGSFSEVRIAQALVGYPSRPGRSRLSLHRAGRIAILDGLRGRSQRTRGTAYPLYFPAPRRAGDLGAISGLFRALPRSYRLSTSGQGPELTSACFHQH